MPQTSTDQASQARAVYASLWRRRWLIALVAAGVMVVAFGVDLLREPTYSSSAEVILQPPSGADPTTSASFDDPAAVDTELRVLASSSVRQRTAEILEMGAGEEPQVGIAVVGESRVAEVTATAGNADDAADLANAYAQAYVEVRRGARADELEAAMAETDDEIATIQDQIDELSAPVDALNELIANATGDAQNQLLRQQQQLADQIDPQINALAADRSEAQRSLFNLRRTREAVDDGLAQVISPAEPATVPISPRPVRDVVAAGILGLVLGAAVVLLLDRLDDTVRSADALAEVTGLPVLGTVPRLTRAQQRTVVTMAEPRSPASESYRTLRTSVQFVQVGRPLQVLHVSSPEQGDGKSLVAANLAVAIAGAGRRTILIDCDLRRPVLHQRFGLASRPGLTSVLVGEATLEEVLQPVPGAEGLRVISAGSIAPNPAEMLASPAAAAMFHQLRELAEVVVVDGPPLLPVTDGQVLARLADATLLVVTAGRSRLNRIRRALDLLRRVEAQVVGTVLNQLDGDVASYTYLSTGDDGDETIRTDEDTGARLPRLSRKARGERPSADAGATPGEATPGPVTTATIDGDRTGDGDDGGR